MNNWIFDIEGVDCSGKATLVKKLVAALRSTKDLSPYEIIPVDFPQYDTPTGRLIKNYLNGNMPEPQKYRSDDTVEERYFKLAANATWIAELFMINRSAYFAENPVKDNAIYIFDRYVYSNAIHQFAKITDYLETPEAVTNMGELMNINCSGDTIDDMCDKCKLIAYNAIVGKWLDMEWMVSPIPDRVFVLNVPSPVIHSRLRARKVAKHEGDDILERNEAVNRSIEFVKWWKDMIETLQLTDNALTFVSYGGKIDMVQVIYENIMEEINKAL